MWLTPEFIYSNFLSLEQSWFCNGNRQEVLFLRGVNISLHAKQTITNADLAPRLCLLRMQRLHKYWINNTTAGHGNESYWHAVLYLASSPTPCADIIKQHLFYIRHCVLIANWPWWIWSDQHPRENLVSIRSLSLIIPHSIHSWPGISRVNCICKNNAGTCGSALSYSK